MVLSRAVLLVGVVAGVGCGSGATPPVDGGDPFTPSLTSNSCFDGANREGIVGCWYAYGSTFTTPVPGDPFPSTGGKMCTAGTVMDMDGSGAAIGFDFNNPGAADAGTGEKLPWDAPANGITGFQFDIDTPPPGGQMRVEFPTSAAIGTTEVNAAYWGGATANLSPFTKGGTYKFHWTEVGGPMDLTAPIAFDSTKILSVQFHVVPKTSSSVPFQYCIGNLYPLTD